MSSFTWQDVIELKERFFEVNKKKGNLFIQNFCITFAWLMVSLPVRWGQTEKHPLHDQRRTRANNERMTSCKWITCIIINKEVNERVFLFWWSRVFFSVSLSVEWIRTKNNARVIRFQSREQSKYFWKSTARVLCFCPSISSRQNRCRCCSLFLSDPSMNEWKKRTRFCWTWSPSFYRTNFPLLLVLVHSIFFEGRDYRQES